MESSRHTYLDLRPAMFGAPTPKPVIVRPAERVMISMGPSGFELGPDEEDKRLNLLLDFLKPSLPCREQARNRKTSNTRLQSRRAHLVGDGFTVATSAVSPAEVAMELQPVSLSLEIVCMIVRYLEKPYKLRGYLPNGTYPDVFFPETRPWAKITALQVCHATRMQAIRRYGNPSPDSLPFDPSMDSFSLEHAPWVCDKPGARPRFNHGTPHKCCKQLGLDLLAKVQCVELEAGVNGWHKDLVKWVETYLTSLKSISTLRLNLYRYDTCNGTTSGLVRHYPMASAIFGNFELLKMLEDLEVNVIGTSCNNTWQVYYALELCHIFPPLFYRPVEAAPDQS